MKRKLLALLAILTVLSATLCLITGCTDASEKQTSVRNPELLQNAPEFITKQLVDFSSDVSNILYIPDGYSNGTPFGVVWNKNNVNFDKETKTMELSLTKGEDKYYGCEVKTYGEAGYVQYGYFGCKMKPSNVVGTASTFFTYTGESDGNPHDEIDIEFLGKDTTRVQFNYFVDGQGGNEYWFDLGFDASEEYHNYGFFWDENRIIWYVDFVPVYAVSGKVPSHPQRVFTNFWAGDKNASDIIAWMGDLSDEDLPAKTCYQDVSVAYLNGWGIELPKGEFIPDVSEFKSSTIELNKGSQDIYTVTTSADKTENTITYTAVQPKSYRNVYGYVDDNVKNSKYIAAKLKNNGEDEVQVRVDIISETVNAAGIQVINTKAWMDGKVVKTDLKYGGSFFTIKGNSEVVCVVEFYGIPSRFMLMCDSFRSGDDTFAGSVTVSDFMYYGENDYVEERVSLDTGYVLLAPGATVQLNATSTGEVVWSVDNPNVATVVDGLVTAVSEGTTSVRATTGSAVALCTIKVTTKSPKEEETLEIVSEDEDLAHKSNITGGVTAKGKQETENTYNNSTEAVALSGAISGESLIFSTLSTWELTSEGYFEFFLRNVGHVPSSNGETINGFYLALTLNGSVVSKEEVKTYKNYNLNCRTSAGNDWYKWTIPFSLFSTAEGTQFNGIKMKVYAAMSSGEYLYIDGIKLSSKAAEGGNTTEIDHSKETLPICDEAVDLLKKENSHWIKGGYQIETVNTYGTSTKAFAWSGCAQYDNMMFYAKIDKSEVKIEENAYIEFFMKDEQRVVGTAPKDLIKIRLYYKNSDDTVGGSKDVLPFSSDLSAYRQDAGNGWTYCKFPLSLFGTMGASFDRIRFQTYVAFSADEILYLDGLNIGGLSEGGGQEGGETTEVDHSSETLTICDEAIDRLTQSAYLIKATGTAVETVNTYGTSTKGIAWTGYVAYKTAIMLYVNSDHSTATVTADGYVEFFLKNVGRNSSVARESGVTLRLYNCADNVKIDGYTDDVRAYKEKHPGCYQDAGNGWTYYKFPLSLFGTMGATFDRIRFTSNLDAKEGETMYIDGLNIVLGTAGGSEEDPHKEETLTICDESVDRSNKEYRYYANGTVAVETVNTYGNSQTALVWSAVPQGENMMFYVNKDKTAVKITQNGYIEFFIKDEGHTADSTARASGVVLRLYNGSSSVKVDGYQDVKAYKEYNASCRQDAGNGWSYYKLPLSMFGTMGASFDRIRITANVAFDSGEAMYIDGFNFVLGDTNTEVNSHAGETLKIVSDDKDLISVSNIIEGVSAKAFKETENTYNDSEEAVAYKGFKAGEVVTFSVGVKYTITENGYIEVFVKNDGRTSTDATGLSFGLYCDKAKVGTEVKAYKTYNTECKSDAGNGWVKWQIPLSLFGLENGAQFDGIRIRVYALMDSTEAFYLDGLQVVE